MPARSKALQRSGLVVVSDLPDAGSAVGASAMLGLQRGSEPDQLQPVSTAEARFHFDYGLLADEDEYDVRGPYIHGRKRERFIYLWWGIDDGTDVELVARSKLLFRDVPSELIAQASADPDLVLTCFVRATDDKGRAATGSVRPPLVDWSCSPS